jgi:hypothetical protein
VPSINHHSWEGVVNLEIFFFFLSYLSTFFCFCLSLTLKIIGGREFEPNKQEKKNKKNKKRKKKYKIYALRERKSTGWSLL